MKKGFDTSIIKEREKQYWCKDDLPLLILIFAAIYVFISFVVPVYILLPVTVQGTSMESTLYENDKVFIFRQGNITYGDIVVLSAPNIPNPITNTMGTEIIKRVLGLPYDTVWFEKEIENNKEIYVFYRQHEENGMLVTTSLKEEFYLKKDSNGDIIYTNRGTKYNEGEKVVLEENEYFVLGDNRSNSEDSRYETVGKVKREQILGKAIFLIRDGRFLFLNKALY